jgi:hypothetical protein
VTASESGLPKLDVQAIGSGALIALAGFGVMSTFWAVAPRQTGLVGFTDYWSATWGDGLCLPVAAAATTYAVRQLPKAPRERAVAMVAGLAGLVLGSATQLIWLSDDKPNLNWTLPEPHHFNAAGAYHAVFLICASAYAGVLTSVAVKRVRAKGLRSLSRPVKVALAASCVATTGFVTLLSVGNAKGTWTLGTSATTGAVVIGAALTAAWIRRSGN